MRYIFLIVCLSACTFTVLGDDDVKVFTVATDKTHGFQRYLRSAKVYKIPVEVLGFGQQWKGGNMNFPGGAHKINLLKQKLKELMQSDNHDETIILFTDSYDVMFLGELDEIVERFKSFEDTRVLFSAEISCWPKVSLASQYPKSESPSRFLNSGGFIGYLPEIYKILTEKEIDDTYDDQLYYTEIFLDKHLRESLKISLDYNSAIFQNLQGASTDVKLKANNTKDWPHIENTVTKMNPLILHGNGPSKLTLNSLGNYLAKSWSVDAGCALCAEKRIELDEKNLPSVMMAVFIEQETPFLEEFLQSLIEVNYPKSKIHLVLRNNVEYHETEVDEFFTANSRYFATAKRIKPSEYITESEARNIAKDRCIHTDCDYMFSIDSIARINKDTLLHLLSSGYDVIAPMLVRPGQAWSNFWGDINSAGFYARSADYMDIVYSVIKGIWNVPFITNCYLVNINVFRTEIAKAHVTYTKTDTDPDMAFCSSLRDAGIFMHVSNEVEFGHLVNPETFDISRTHPDIYQVIDNKIEWENRYLHPDYHVNFEEGRKHLMPCPDVYWFPVMSKRFCVEWIAVMEAFGRWSNGTNEDERLLGGYEAVPTRDIHMTQVGLDRQWLHILNQYVRPLQEMVFIGYHNTPNSLLNFVVRYRPDEQPSLRPHHDSSTYTINLALNTPHVDYEGGGCRFIRYDCSVRDTKVGWLLMHPGRLTHYHEGLRVTNGTRYIMISFVDP